LEPGRATMALQRATMATMCITHTPARLTVTIALTGSPAVSLSALARGSAAIMAVAAITAVAATVVAATVVVDQPMEDAVALLEAAQADAHRATPDAVVSLEAAQVDADRLEVASEAVLQLEASQEVAAEAALAEAALAVADAGKFNIPAGSTLHLKRSA
jgi:hypothetical protein